jgi:hypothetical protein
MITLSIVIVNWNTGQILLDCLESIYSDPPGFPFEVFVVDNASTDGSALTAQSRYPQAKVILSDVNLGFARGNNRAIEQAQGDFVLLLNPDTILKGGALQTLKQFLEDHPDSGAAGAMLLNPDGSLQYSCSPEPTLAREFLRLFHLGGVRPDGYYNMGEWNTSEPRRVEVLLGACVMIRREALKQVGLLDEGFFMYSEEVDYCRRLRDAGWLIYWVPQAKVVHLGGQSTRQAAVRMFLELYKAKVQYFRKHHGSVPAQLYKLILFFAGLARLISAPLIWLQPGSKAEDRQNLVTNYRQLLKALPGM